MKICYECSHENFNSNDVCARCGQSINNIHPEIFNIAGFIKQNFQLYVIFGVLVALYEYLIQKPRYETAIFPLLIALYLILHLIYKGIRIVKSKNWQSNEELIRRESTFQCLIFVIIHISLIVALLISLFENIPTLSAQIIVGNILAMFLFVLYFSANFSNEQYRKSAKILLWGIFLYEIAVMLVLFIPLFAKITDNNPIFTPIINNPSFPTVYTGIFQFFLCLGVGAFLAYGLLMVVNNTIWKERVPYFIILNRERSIKIWLIIDVIFGIVLLLVFLFIQQLYAIL
jgi:hypothetical protein